MTRKLELPYTVEQDEAGCEKCGNGKTWNVVDPDDMALGISYGDKDEAEDMAEELNRAFALGQAKAAAGVWWSQGEGGKEDGHGK